MKLHEIHKLIERWNASAGWPEAGDDDIIALYTVLPKLLAVAEAAKNLKQITPGYWSEPLKYDDDELPLRSSLDTAFAALETDE